MAQNYRSGFRRALARLAIGLLAATTSGCTVAEHHATPAVAAHSPSAAVSPSISTTAARYVGSETCIQCHPAEGAKWLGSGHQQTLHLMDSRLPVRLRPAVGVIPNTNGDFSLAVNGSHYEVLRNGDSSHSLRLRLALGSGKAVMTYLALAGGRSLEFRESYAPGTKAWFPTPDSETLSSSEAGRISPPESARRCVLCHATTLPEDGLIPAPRFLGVGCERCHGPGSGHVAAVTGQRSHERGIEDLRTWSASRLDALCGSCHRNTDNVDLASYPAASTNRFEPYGLSLSRCFRESGGRLSCVTCHDPHTDVNKRTSDYERVCLSCHASPVPSQSPTHAISSTPTLPSLILSGSHGQPGKPCPVSPRTGCISCHMPSRKAILDSPIPIYMADHWIRVYRAHSP